MEVIMETEAAVLPAVPAAIPAALSAADSPEIVKNGSKDYKAEMQGVEEDGESGSGAGETGSGAGETNKRKAMFPQLFTPAGPKKLKRSAMGGPVQPKNACVALNEYKPGLDYVLVEQRGQVHEPTFVIEVKVNGQEFIGEGKSKKLAKQAAAEKALKSIVQFRNPLEAQVAMGQLPVLQGQPIPDFTCDVALHPGTVSTGHTFHNQNSAKNGHDGSTDLPGDSPVLPAEAQPDHPAGASPPQQQLPVIDQYKNPVMSLNELKPGLEYLCKESGDSPATKRFLMSVTIDSQQFEGSGSSKKLAKQACARSALCKLYNASFTPTQESENTSGKGSTGSKLVIGTGIPLSEFSIDQCVADNVGKLVLERFEQLMVGNIVGSRRKVIAGIVTSRGGQEMRDLTVVTVTTGTKCVNGEYMSVSGNSLNDCHAEIISRRCLLRYLYSQLEKIAENKGKVPADSILEAADKGSGYRVKPDVRFHLYINTAPCGDARIFSPHEAKTGEDDDRHSNRRSRGQLRTKIESGEGTIPVRSSDGIQTWDGVMQGARLLTMSCSDKICRWNVLGIQGSLLSYYLEPVYLNSIVLGSLFHSTHMLRAVTGRIQTTMSGLPPPYRLNTPRLNLLSSPEVRQPGKAPNHSVNWTTGDSSPEIIDAMKGKEQETNNPSRLCKASLYSRWLDLAKSGCLESRLPLPATEPGPLYSEAKQASKDFQTAKDRLFKAFKKAQLGDWVKKPIEQDEF